MKENKKVLVAMSGGVDSSVAAVLLKNQGYEVIGVHLQLWDHSKSNVDKLGGRCCSITDSNDARRVCDKIDVPFYMINAHDLFMDKVVDYFVHEYVSNRTPNPCVKCNSEIKFNYLFQKADELGCQWVATGHYAQIQLDYSKGVAHLCKAVDLQKDQSYFLFGMTQAALKRTLMPLGGFQKIMVRKLADQFGLNVAQKPDSQEICFVDNDNYADFIEKRVSPSFKMRGVIRSKGGDILGEHDGLFRYTIGQRKGLKLIGKNTENLYVTGFDFEGHNLYVGPEEMLFQNQLVATEVSWVRPVDELRILNCKAKIRSRHEEAACSVQIFENKTIQVTFEQPQRAITPGQAVVFYDGDEVLGGGFIQRASGL